MLIPVNAAAPGEKLRFDVANATRYLATVIRSFAERETERGFGYNGSYHDLSVFIFRMFFSVAVIYFFASGYLLIQRT